MRRLWLIWFLLMVMTLACNRSAVEVCHGASISQELAAIDTLMQTRPDSALCLLLEKPMDGPYYQLLLSEALYKNDSAQLNRPELLSAITYFDSAGCPYLAARCHYMNGVGYYEMDSVISACQEYLKALEIMEEHYEEQDLVGNKAKFMALAYTRLTDVFSSQYLHEQAIYFGKQSLSYYYKVNTESWETAWMLDEIGANYDMLGDFDSAYVYYSKGMEVLSDTQNLTYRGLIVHQAFLEYEIKKDPVSALKLLYRQLDRSESVKEYLSRGLTIGEIYFWESQFDSAYLYLKEVFQLSESIDSKKQAAEWLVEICKAQNRVSEMFEYTVFLAPFATQEENKSNIKSQLVEIYNNHKQKKTVLHHQQKLENQTRHTILIIISLLLFVFLFFTLYRIDKRKQQKLEAKIKEEQYAHEIKQKALLGRLKHSNEAMRIQKDKTSNLAKIVKTQQKQARWSSLDDFMNEDICQEILLMLCNKHIKRESKRGDYPELFLNNNQLSSLRIAVEKHFCGFEKSLTDIYPKINRNTMNQCFLYLLDLEDVQVAALLSCDYTTVKKRSLKLKEVFNTKKEPCQYIRELILQRH